MGQQLRIQVVEYVALRIGVGAAGLDLDTEGEHTLAQRGLQLGVMGGDGALSVDIRDRWHRGAPLRLCPCKPRVFPSASVSGGRPPSHRRVVLMVRSYGRSLDRTSSEIVRDRRRGGDPV